MNGLSVALIVFGLLNIVLGVLAYSKSAVSLYAGGGAGIVAIVAALISRSNPKVGYIIGVIVCIALLGRFLPKVIADFQAYPGGLIVVSSAIMLVALIVGFFQIKS